MNAHTNVDIIRTRILHNESNRLLGSHDQLDVEWAQLQLEEAAHSNHVFDHRKVAAWISIKGTAILNQKIDHFSNGCWHRSPNYLPDLRVK